MVYNPLSAVQAIARYKNMYANAADDTERKKIAENEDLASKYAELVKNGRGDIADTLHKSDYTGATKLQDGIQDGIGTKGRVQLRDYAKTRLKDFGGIGDNEFGYNVNNKDVTIKGVNIGGGAYESSDGRTYMSQADADKALDNVIKTNNLSRTYAVKAGTTSEDLIKRRQEILDRVSGGMTKSSTYQDVLGEWQPKSVAAGNNAVASGAADNGGNIDSSAAANGERQREATYQMGKAEARNSWLAEMGLQRDLLNDYGGTSQDMFNNGQTENLNNAKINESVAGILGTVPNAVSVADNPYFNPDGSFKNVELDYGTIINDPTKSEQTKTYARQARAMKVLIPMYEQYAGEANFDAPQETAAVKQARATLKAQADSLKAQTDLGYAQIGSNENIAGLNANTQRYVSDSKQTTESQSYKPTITAAVAKESYDNGVRTPAVIEAYNYYYGTNISPDDNAPLGEDGKVLSNEERVKRIIFKTPSDGSNKTYYPIQELLANRSNYESSTSKEYVDKLIVEEAKKIAKAEGRKVGSWEIDDILKANGFTDHKELKKLFE